MAKLDLNESCRGVMVAAHFNISIVFCRYYHNNNIMYLHRRRYQFVRSTSKIHRYANEGSTGIRDFDIENLMNVDY